MKKIVFSISSPTPRCGKDTVGNLIELFYKEKKVARYAWATKLKEFSKEFGYNEDNKAETREILFKCSSAIKEHLGKYTLLDIGLEDIRSLLCENDILIVTDTRFEFEDFHIGENQDIANIIRIGVERDSASTDLENHNTQKDYPKFKQDHIFLNNGNLKELKEQVFELLEKYSK